MQTVGNDDIVYKQSKPGFIAAGDSVRSIYLWSNTRASGFMVYYTCTVIYMGYKTHHHVQFIPPVLQSRLRVTAQTTILQVFVHSWLTLTVTWYIDVIVTWHTLVHLSSCASVAHMLSFGVSRRVPSLPVTALLLPLFFERWWPHVFYATQRHLIDGHRGLLSVLSQTPRNKWIGHLCHNEKGRPGNIFLFAKLTVLCWEIRKAKVFSSMWPWVWALIKCKVKITLICHCNVEMGDISTLFSTDQLHVSLVT